MDVGFGRDGCSVRTLSISTMPGPWQNKTSNKPGLQGVGAVVLFLGFWMHTRFHKGCGGLEDSPQVVLRLGMGSLGFYGQVFVRVNEL